ncbi:MAG: calcium-binding protein [Bdellovibrio sp. ArHS]|uniref:EF-hand domain-containing protein n=1 Tax=Bdellovibrio sp. ArHS TaxID=1569284 RepID=UPI00058303B9|nr:EF-hand domain-containing protein [Bdellovibrio sp. ArHS]KHD89638.1 MAG: calcium-binding protein [Bdellovibrio sp. ArHS]
MRTSIKNSVALGALVFWGIPSLAADKDFPMSVNSATSGESVVSAPASGLVTRSGKTEVMVKVNNSCFGTNLRGVGNPLAPSSIIKASFILVMGGKEYEIKVDYPAMLVTAAGLSGNVSVTPMDADKYSIPGGGSAGIFGNSVILKTPIPTSVSVDDEGNITESGKGPVYLKSYSFNQEVTSCTGTAVYGSYGYSSSQPTYPCGAYMGKSGPLSASFGGISVSSDKSNIDINVAFPGQTGFCGGYWSPLMVFWDEQRPKFDAISDFPLNPFGKTMWPEAKSPGWFVALDRDGSGMIDQRNELFGDNADQVNGFEVLKKFDTNKDGFIDKKDKEFKKLVLWNDANGDGVSQKEEVVKLSAKITKISLNYEKGVVRPIGRHAEARERAKFWYTEKGKVKQGDIIDIWLAPAEMKLSQR